ncbi:hypothetical protein G5V58_21285 [Nocardioides anomalus]|uniref:Uncharacterized protein n=1 Tax=Nocardioides anomalus TaxID=2712223 RepID=A0A6G6WID2_9ACTN|nr:hypothetical protein [Nocardioides anomalus]QIG44966.1 hypothetical protein G5V58_21285 [Nocardioides anomalus]
MSVRVAERSDKYDHLLQLADLFDSSGDRLRSMAGLGAEILRDDAVADSAELSASTHALAEEDIRAATTGKHGLLSRSIELDADALVVRATVLTYQWIDELRDAAYETLGAVAGRAIGYLAPNVALGGAIVTAGLIETDALDRDGVSTYLSELAEANPELMDHVVSGGGGLLDGLQMRSALTVPSAAGEAARQVARGGLRAVGVQPLRQDSSAALRDVAAGLLTDPRPAPEPATGVEPPCVPTSLVDLMTRLDELDGKVLVHRTAPGRYVAYVGRPPAVSEDGLRLSTGDLSPYAAEVARTVAAAVAGDEQPHVMTVGTGAGGAVAAELGAQRQPLPFTVDQVITAGAPAAQVPRLPSTTRMLALEDRADPVALLGSLIAAGDDNRVTVVFDAAGSSSESVYVAGARTADASPDVVAELDRLRGLGYLA